MMWIDWIRIRNLLRSLSYWLIMIPNLSRTQMRRRVDIQPTISTMRTGYCLKRTWFSMLGHIQHMKISIWTTPFVAVVVRVREMFSWDRSIGNFLSQFKSIINKISIRIQIPSILMKRSPRNRLNKSETQVKDTFL